MISPKTTPADTVCIAGVGFAVPKNIRANSEILKAFPNRTEAEIVRLTGIKERRYADDDESATSLAAVAVEHALAQAGLRVRLIDRRSALGGRASSFRHPVVGEIIDN